MTKPTTTLWIATTAYKSGLVIKRNGEMPNYQQLQSNHPLKVEERMRMNANKPRKKNVLKTPRTLIKEAGVIIEMATKRLKTGSK